MPFPLYSVYLLPPTGLAASIDTLREELEQRFGCHAARSLMVHCPLKGFFRLAEDKTEEHVQQALETVLSPFPAFEVQPKEVTRFPDAVILDLASLSNPRLQELHTTIFQQLDPAFVHPDCPFTPTERKYGFVGHITLAAKDLPANDFNEALEFAQQAAKERNLLEPFVARTLVLTRFTTQATDWEDTNRWWESLRYTTLHTWRLRMGCLSNLGLGRQPAERKPTKQTTDADIQYA